MTVRNGSCGCRALKYSVEGEAINSVFCYCKDCQVHTGSDKWFGAWFSVDNLKIVSGNPTVFTRKGDSGKNMNYMFCEKCGTTICVEVTLGNFYSVAVSTLDNTDNFAPSMAIYTASAPNWAVFPEGVPKFEMLPPNLDG
ncbi:MAG: hypothetical protein DRR04_05235 [Gammaproteobacteria bacterium]|nr:MAG: hypothetical protein DRQ97_03495 [Gammaproteobacteria bacterium]RLA60586.1 MAG: hypothetical protein DRR04_05235 [Gammaproteobacteria bacterium]